MEAATEESFFLHIDIITQILLMLPVKSLLRFKTVCKSWQALIKDPRFDSQRRKLQLLTGGYAGRIFVYSPQQHSCSASLVIRNIHPRGIDLELPYQVKQIFRFSICSFSLFDQIMIVGPYNGVYLLYDRYGNYVIWNHATRDYKVVSQMDVSSYDSHLVTCGSGSDELLEGGLDFLIVRVHKKRFETWDDTPLRHPQLYKYSTGVWSDLKMPFPKESWECYSTEYIDGVFYWLGQDWKEVRYFLVSFDTRNEISEEIDLPVSIGARDKLSCYVSDDGNKFLSLMIILNRFLDIWVRKEMDVSIGKCWLKVETLSYKGRSVYAEVADLKGWMPSGNIQFEESLVSL